MSELVPSGRFLVYVDEVGHAKIDVRFDGDTVWLTQAQLVELFDSSKANISEHIKHIFEDEELAEESVVRKFRTTAADGKSYLITHYNLDMVISVGYRVKSKTATAFRIWATQRLREYIVKGFVLDDERLANPDLPFDYFDELLERIQSIRTSERRFYQKITDVYATSTDYDGNAEQTQWFFATVQNKLHWAITGATAAEIIHQRADALQPNMGLTSWRGVEPRSADVEVAKNYYAAEELAALNNLVEQYLVFAEGQARREIPMRMADWITKLNGFLTLNDRYILTGAGRVSHALAVEQAKGQYQTFSAKRSEQESDFDKFVRRVESKEEGAAKKPPAITK